MPESVFTQTMPSLLAGGVCCCAVEAGLAGAEEADEFAGAGVAVAVGLVVAGAGAAEPAGAELAAGVLSVDGFADLLERDFFVLPVSAEASALGALSAGFLERVFFVAAAEESAAVGLSAASADFLDRLFFVPVSLAELSAVFGELSAVSADFLDRLFWGLLLSAVAPSAWLALALFLDRLFVVVELSAAAGLSAPFVLDLDLVLLESAEAAAPCEESSAWAFFFLDFLAVEVSV